MPIDLSAALEYHRRGELDQAAKAYEAALAQEPDSPEALHLLGVVALQRGNPARAAALIGRAVALRPNEIDYYAHLSAAFWAMGRLDDTIRCCHAALRIRPDNPEILCTLGTALVDLKRVDEGITCFRAALQIQPDNPGAQNNLANALRLQGDKAGALEHFRLAAQLQPNRAEVRNNLGQTLLERGDAQEALVHCEAAVRLRPEYAFARQNLGKVLRECGRLEESRECFREVIRLNPDLSAAHTDLGGVLEDLGEFDQALDAYRTALRLNPRDPLALARVATILRDRLPDSDRMAIEGVLADSTLSPEWRWTLDFGLAQALDARGEFDRAAALSIEANALRRADFQKWGRGYDPAAHHAFIDRLIQSFTPQFFESVRGFGVASERPVFVMGMPRSGTTLAEQILASHPKVFGAGELRLVRETVETLPELTRHRGMYLDCLHLLDADVVQTLAHHYLDALAALDDKADRVVDKMPENTFHLGLIATLFPHAKLIHCRRDLRDIALSCWLTDFTHVRWASDPAHLASRIQEYERLTNHWRRVLPVPVFELDYETLVSDPEGVSRSLVAWCGLEWDSACLEFHKTRRPLQTASAPQVRRALFRSSVGRWKHYEHSLAPLLERLTPT